MASTTDTYTAPDLSGAVVTTTFFLVNLHCNSCIQSIDASILALEPSPLDIKYSILDNFVAIKHRSNLTLPQIVAALESAGFDIHSIFQKSGDHSDTEVFRAGLGQHDSAWEASLESAVSRWRKLLGAGDADEKRRVHVAHCEQCQKAPLVESSRIPAAADTKHDTSSSTTETSSKQKDHHEIESHDAPFVIVEAPRENLFRVSLSVTGMFCSSCVATITSAIKDLDFVKSADIMLISNSASIVVNDEKRAGELVSTIENLGYDAEIHLIDNLSDSPTLTLSTESDTWKASFAITGMTCSSCVGSIESALKALDYVIKVDISLLTNSGTISFYGKENASNIKESIEDLGYEATLDSLSGMSATKAKSESRSASLRVEGMFCEHCPKQIEVALGRTYGDRLSIQKQLSVKSDILEISYTASPPEFTLRQIIATIRNVNEAFSVEVFHRPTLEQRSKDMQARERDFMLIRLTLCAVAAIPSLIIGIIAMQLVSENSHLRMYFMKPIWAGVPRAIWALFFISTPVYFFAADAFHKRALKEIWAMWKPHSTVPFARRFFRFGSMNLLMSLGTSIAYFASIVELALVATDPSKRTVSATDIYFDSVVFLTFFLLIGRFLEAFSKAKTGDAVTSLGKLRPKEAMLVEREKDTLVSIDLLEIGDVIRVPSGSSPPFDGTVISGQSRFDESSLTGESRLLAKKEGDEIFSGTVNKGDVVTIRLTTISGTSMLDKIITVVREGQSRRAPIERAADLVTGHFVPAVCLLGILTWLVWLTLGYSGALPQSYKGSQNGGWAFWSLQFAISVIIIACPCGFGLAAPTALYVGGGLAASHGILVKGGGEAFQEASSLDAIVLDKTGTITEGGAPKVTNFQLFSAIKESAVISMARKLESNSSHPVARAIATYRQDESSSDVTLARTVEIAGKGMKSDLKSTSIPGISAAIIGNEALMADFNVGITQDAADLLETWKSEGNSVALVAAQSTESRNWTLTAAFAIADAIRPEARSTIAALRSRSIDVWLVSGDNETTARAVGARVGIPTSNIIAGVLPDQKAAKIRHLQRTLPPKGSRSSLLSRLTNRVSNGKGTRALVAMVGDGINDAPALSAADVGIAIGSGSDVALSSASFVLVSSRLSTLLTLVDLSRKVFARVWFNFGWALVYNLLAMPVAAGVLYPVRNAAGGHVRLDPAWASLAMALSSFSVVCSSLMLRTRIPVLGFVDRGSGGEVEDERRAGDV